jgi:hypothetical protein
MQHDFDNLALCDDPSFAASLGFLAKGIHSQRSKINSELDKETLKQKYSNISEAAIISLIKWQYAAENCSLPRKGIQLVSIKCNGDQGKFEGIPKASPAGAPSLLPPPKRFSRLSRRETRTTI